MALKWKMTFLLGSKVIYICNLGISKAPFDSSLDLYSIAWRYNSVHVFSDPNGRKISNEVKLDQSSDLFTCEFTTSTVGEHTIEIYIKNEKVDATPSFYTYDATKIKVGDIPSGLIGMPVDFNVDGSGAGFGNLEISVNGGRVTCHVAKAGEEKFTANFIPHDAGRHRLDVKFNGDKVPGSPWFCEVKDPNLPLTAPGLLTGKIKAKDLNGYDHANNNSWEDSTLLTSKDFKNLDSSYLDDYSNSTFLTKTTTTTTTKKESTVQNTYKKASTFDQKMKVIDDGGPVVKASISDKKSKVKMEPAKDFGSFSSLMAPQLLSGKKSAQEYDSSAENHQKSSIIEKESQSFDLNDSSATYSTTLNTQVNKTNGATNGFKEESFTIKDNGYSGFKLERSTESKNSTGYFGSTKESSMMDELSRNPLFNRPDRSRSRSRSKSPIFEKKSPIFDRKSPVLDKPKSSLFSKDRSKSPVERTLPIRRERSKTPDKSLAKSPVPSKRKTPPPPPARKTSSPGRSMIPKRTPSVGTSESKQIRYVQ